jgi:glutathione S-transferase
LEKSAWLAGAGFSAADIMMSFVLEAAASRGGPDARYPRLQQFIRGIHERPAYRRAIERGGAYDFAR